ncbi:hypothetical protein [Nocardioides coralli]|uniref:hypothetical protein n=1 Tax=Nocardioides coralli TaxID=2872154 RepID=UPI001CA3FD27|nr:hypothetical protein [Nocardioides coralli]QZY28192.1 hypothetical protein K6T13_11930 [Nocardioides coralli]
MKHLMPAAVAVATTALIGTVTLAAPAHADPSACDDAVAGALHTAHELAGPAGEPVHVVEDAYCGVAP